VVLSSADNINWNEEARWTGDPGGGGNDAIPLIGENPNGYSENGFDCVAFEFDGTSWAAQGVIKYFNA
jgi:hypothetical protein